MIKKYRSKEIEVQAMRVSFGNWVQLEKWSELPELWNSIILDEEGKIKIVMPTSQGVMTARDGDYLVRFKDGKIFPFKTNIFERIYEEAKK